MLSGFSFFLTVTKVWTLDISILKYWRKCKKTSKKVEIRHLTRDRKDTIHFDCFWGITNLKHFELKIKNWVDITNVLTKFECRTCEEVLVNMVNEHHFGPTNVLWKSILLILCFCFLFGMSLWIVSYDFPKNKKTKGQNFYSPFPKQQKKLFVCWFTYSPMILQLIFKFLSIWRCKVDTEDNSNHENNWGMTRS